MKGGIAMVEGSIVIKNCTKSKELWALISSKIQVMFDELEDGSAFVTLDGNSDDALEVAKICLQFGSCEIEINSRD